VEFAKGMPDEEEFAVMATTIRGMVTGK